MGNKWVLYMPMYYGTIMQRHLNGKDTIYKENALLQYDIENNEYFYHGEKEKEYEGIKNYIRWVYNTLESIEDEEVNRIVKEHRLMSSIPNVEGALYVDESTLVKVKENGISRK